MTFIKTLLLFTVLFFSPLHVIAAQSTYKWTDFREEFTNRAKVCHNKPITLEVDLPQSFVDKHNRVEMDFTVRSRSYQTRHKDRGYSFESYEPLIMVNGSFWGTYRVPVAEYPATQSRTIKIKKKYIKAGLNNFKIGHSWRNNRSCAGTCCGFYLEKVAFTDAPPAHYTVSVNTNPSGAEVFLDQTYRGVAPLKIEIKKGFYDLKVKKDGFMCEIRYLEFPGDSNYQQITLDKITISQVAPSKVETISPQLNKVRLSETTFVVKATPITHKVLPKPQDLRKLCLIVGNSRYPSGRNLKNPVNDARAISDKLQNLGFDVLTHLDTTQKELKIAIDQFGKKLKDYDVGLFFYAGHGVQVSGTNYLIPIDAVLTNVNDVEYDCVQVGRILAKMEHAANKTNIIVLDACRDNPFERSWTRGVQAKGLAFMDAPTGTIIAYSTSPGKTAYDGDTQNSVYTAALLEHIDAPGLSILQMFQKVRKKVIETSQGKQTPWESTSLTEDFFFQKL